MEGRPRRPGGHLPGVLRRVDAPGARVVGGYEADIVALSLGPDVDEIADAGLITHDWTQETDGGMVTTSVVVFDVRPGNPLGIEDWDDLRSPGWRS